MIDVTPAQVLDEWVERLRSGEDIQGTGHLCSVNNGVRAYCCLGILSEIGVKHGLLTSEDDGTAVRYRWHEGHEFEDVREDILPLAFAQWLHIDQDPMLGAHKATVLNDDMHYSFATIANAARTLVQQVHRYVEAVQP